MKNVFFLVALVWVTAPAMADDEILARPATQEQMGFCSETQACPSEAPPVESAKKEFENCVLKQAPAVINQRAKGQTVSSDAITTGAMHAADENCFKFEEKLTRDEAFEAFGRVRDSLLIRYLGI